MAIHTYAHRSAPQATAVTPVPATMDMGNPDLTHIAHPNGKQPRLERGERASITAAMASTAKAPRTVSVLLHDGMLLVELGIVSSVFSYPFEGDLYRLSICSEGAKPVPTLGGATVHIDGDLETFASAQTVIVPSADVDKDCSPDVVEALRLARRRGSRVVSICTGAFTLAAAGLLDGRRAVTHWKFADLLAQRYPLVKVDPKVLYVDDGDIVTGAGCAAGLDVCLHLVRKDFGPTIAGSFARQLVVPPHREGGQAQFIPTPAIADEQDNPISRTMAWALENLHKPITVASLAQQAHMAERTYLRRFSQTTGTTPIQWLIAQRIYASLSQLETTTLPVEEISASVGIDNVVTYRHHFKKVMLTSPSAYRRAFNTTSISPSEPQH